MKAKELLLFLIPVLVLAGCVQVSFEGVKALMGVGEPQYIASEKLSISATSVLSELEGGETTDLLFDLKNTGNMSIGDVKINLTDTCVFNSTKKKESKNIGDLDPGQAADWNLRMESEPVDIERMCDIRYRVSYDSNATARYDIAALSEDEYLRLKRGGDLKKEVSLNYYKTDTPVDIQISLSDKQPVVGGDRFYLTLKLVNQGNGKVEGQKIKEDNLVLEYPDFLTYKRCQDVMTDPSDNSVKLKGDRTFYEGETTPMTCGFKVEENQIGISEQGVFKVRVKYKYVLNEKISIKVIPE